MEERRRSSKKRRKNSFKKFLLIYSSIFAIFMIGTWILLFQFIQDYEEGQPKHVMEELIDNFTSDRLLKLVGSDITTSEFETKESVVEYLESCAKGGELSYRKKAGEYSEKNPVYEIVAGKQPIAKVLLASNEKNGFHFDIWTIGSVNISDYISGEDAKVYQVLVPEGSKFTINNVEVADTYIIEENVAFDPCKNVSDYVTAPVMTRYEIKGLLFEPEMKVTFQDTELTYEEEGDALWYQYPESEELLAEHKDEIEQLAKNYGLYLINKLDLSTLTQVMIGSAAAYVSDIPAIWAYKSGGVESFEDLTVSNCRKYSEDCFSVDISYRLHVTWPTKPDVEDKDYNTNMTYTYVKYNGAWKMADFELNK